MKAGRRLVFTGALGVVAGTAMALAAPWVVAALVGWDVTAAVLAAAVWFRVWHLDSSETSRYATREDSSRGASELLLLCAAVACLGGVGFVLIKASKGNGFGVAVLIALGILSVVLSWLVVHTVFTLRYASLYYTGPDGGIDFKEHERPDYGDFAYLAFTVGMTFQVSDTDVQTKPIRRTVLRHALLSYLFGAVIVAVTINAVAGLLK